jgi:hypothetical protein
LGFLGFGKINHQSRKIPEKSQTILSKSTWNPPEILKKSSRNPRKSWKILTKSLNASGCVVLRWHTIVHVVV